MRQFNILLVFSAAVTPLLLGAPAADAFVSAELVASGLNRPIYVTAPAGDARLFIVEQRGVIKILKEGAVLATPFLDIDSLVKDPTAYSEQGLLGLAFHPDYANNRRFFVHYSDLNGDTVIARYEADQLNPDVANQASAEIVLTWDQPVGNHNGGTIAFGPDGYLYFGFGDGGGAGDPNDLAQDPSTLLGKFIRIDVDSLPYSIPPDNPYVGNASVLDEIWAIGLRNPYRWSFDRSTGDLWIADVGQSLWEEVDFQPASSAGGENYGWSFMEGLHCYDPPVDCGADTLDLPVYEYGHGSGECSITGGYVYRGAAIPDLQGYYLFGDFCSNRIWALEYDGNMITTLLDVTDHLNQGGQIEGLAGFGEDGAGELYLVDRAGTTDGEIYKIVPDPAGVDDGGYDTGTLHGLGPAFPNPTPEETEVSLVLQRPAHVNATVFNAAGRPVRRLVSGLRPEGTYRLVWDGTDRDGRDAASGVYFLRVEVDGETGVRKVNLVR